MRFDNSGHHSGLSSSSSNFRNTEANLVSTIDFQLQFLGNLIIMEGLGRYIHRASGEETGPHHTDRRDESDIQEESISNQHVLDAAVGSIPSGVHTGSAQPPEPSASEEQIIEKRLEVEKFFLEEYRMVPVTGALIPDTPVVTLAWQDLVGGMFGTTVTSRLIEPVPLGRPPIVPFEEFTGSMTINSFRMILLRSAECGWNMFHVKLKSFFGKGLCVQFPHVNDFKDPHETELQRFLADKCATVLSGDGRNFLSLESEMC